MPEFLRRPQHLYEDPLARLWTLCAERIGFRVERTPEVYASTDGHGTLLIGNDDTLDPDDSLAQMILHELCHALVEGEQGERLPDWGLDNTSNKHLWREQACLRLQAYLAGSVGLRDFFAPTTDFRVSFWGRLSANPFAAPAQSGGRREPSCVAARRGAWRASQLRWAPHLKYALEETAAIGSIMKRAAETSRDDRKERRAAMPSLWTTVREAPVMHPAGHSTIADYHADHGCGDCAWSFTYRKLQRCRHAPKVALPDAAPACARWEPAQELACEQCGACCGEAYHAVEVAAGESVIRRHPNLVVDRGSRYTLRRTGDRCAALVGGRTASEPYACEIYPDRPRTCREFTPGSSHCLDARRRVGLSL